MYWPSMLAHTHARMQGAERADLHNFDSKLLLLLKRFPFQIKPSHHYVGEKRKSKFTSLPSSSFSLRPFCLGCHFSSLSLSGFFFRSARARLSISGWRARCYAYARVSIATKRAIRAGSGPDGRTWGMILARERSSPSCYWEEFIAPNMELFDENCIPIINLKR